MKKLLIGIIILGNIFTFAGCGNNSSKNIEANSQPQQSTTQQDSSTSGIDKNKTDNEVVKPNDADLNKDTIENKDSKSTKDTKDTAVSKKEINDTKITKTPSKNTIVENRVKDKVKEHNQKPIIKNNSISKYYGTWRIEKVIGQTKVNSNNKSPLGKTLVIGKNLYSNNSFNIQIENPKYLITKISEKDFCRGYNINSLKGTGLNEGTVTALDITSDSNPNSEFDELYIQDGYLIYLQEGVFFKCTRG